MKSSKSLQKGFGIALMLAVIASLAIAAPDQQGQRGQRGPGMRGGFDPAAMQQRMMQRMKEQLGASDEEWTVIEPRLSKVMELQRDTNSRGRMRGMMRGGRGGRGPQGQNANNAQQQSDVQKAVTDLQQTLEKDSPATAEIQAKLTALRGAREKAKQELAKAQQQLKEVLTVKQEAQLVLMGMLD